MKIVPQIVVIYMLMAGEADGFVSKTYLNNHNIILDKLVSL